MADAQLGWIFADPAHAGSVRFTGPGNPEVLPLEAAAANDRAATTRAWTAVSGFAGVPHLNESGMPIVPSAAFASAPPKALSAHEGVTVDKRIVAVPDVAPRAAGATTSGSANPTTVNFGSQPIYVKANHDVTITVDAGYRTEIASGSGLNVPFAFDFGTCGSGGGFTGPGTCTVTESYTPNAFGAASGTTNVFECPIAGGSCIAIPYNVQGTGISVAGANPSAVTYGGVAVNTTALRSVTITVDAGYRTEIASGSGLNAPFAFDFNSCGVGGGFTGPGTCTVNELFTPTTLSTSNGTTNVFECPLIGGSCITIPYTSQGTGVSVATANPSTVAFGSVGFNVKASQDVIITVDAGYRTEVASGSGLNAPFAFNFNTCGAGGGFTGPGTCTVTESLTPTSPGFVSGAMNVFECPVLGGACIGIPFSAQGTGVSLAIASPTTVDFTNVSLNTTASRNVTLTVDTGYRTEIASGSGLNPPFAFDFNNCGAAGGFTGPGTCTVVESFTPTVLGAAGGITNVFECPIAGGSCLAIPYNDTGAGVVGPPVLQSAVSRRVHGAAGTFDLPLSAVPTNPSTEPRQGPAQTVVFTFDKPATGATAGILEGTATTAAPIFSGNDVIVGLSGVLNAQYVTLSLTNITSSDGGVGGSASVRIGFLLADVNQNRVVTVADLALVNAQLTQLVTSANYLKDVNASGTLTVADRALTNGKLTTALPAP